MAEYNAMSNRIEGKPDGKKFYMNDGLINLDGEKISTEKRLDLMKQDAGVKSDIEYEKEVNDITEYNEALKTPSEEALKYKLNGNAVMIRLFKHYTTKKIGSLFVDNKLVIPYQTEGGKYATRENPLQFVYRGVINNISDQCTEVFRSKFKVGDIVDLKLGLNLMQQRVWLDPVDYFDGEFDNWFIINENMIEKGLL